jgi:predicted type IV restriction endonuclease
MINIDIRRQLKKYIPYLVEGNTNNLNEADTVQRLIKVLEEVLGYDGMSDITRESLIKDKYVDIAVKINGQTVFLIEAKAGGVELRSKHIEQAQNYAAHGNIKWVLLTNGLHWILYHLTFDDGIEYDKAFDITVSDENFDHVCRSLSVLHKKCVASDGLMHFWEHRVALSFQSIGQAIFTEDVLNAIRRELRKKIGVRVEEDALVNSINSMFSVEARERIGPPRIKRKRKARVKVSSEDAKNVGELIEGVLQ